LDGWEEISSRDEDSMLICPFSCSRTLYLSEGLGLAILVIVPAVAMGPK